MSTEIQVPNGADHARDAAPRAGLQGDEQIVKIAVPTLEDGNTVEIAK